MWEHELVFGVLYLTPFWGDDETIAAEWIDAHGEVVAQDEFEAGTALQIKECYREALREMIRRVSQ